jgi:hypothetical protein
VVVGVVVGAVRGRHDHAPRAGILVVVFTSPAERHDGRRYPLIIGRIPVSGSATASWPRSRGQPDLVRRLDRHAALGVVYRARIVSAADELDASHWLYA